jgi:hypothetical protein
MKLVPYAPAVGSFMYAMVIMRPDIAHAVGVIRYLVGVVRYLHAQSRPTTLERSEAYLQISSWHTRL